MSWHSSTVVRAAMDAAPAPPMGAQLPRAELATVSCSGHAPHSQTCCAHLLAAAHTHA
jgi:hypothetical protein